jgi:hypothetical protein
MMAQGIFVELMVPDDSFLDVFCSGQARVDQYFHTREWLAEKSKGGSLTTYVFRAGEAGPVVGYAALLRIQSAPFRWMMASQC